MKTPETKTYSGKVSGFWHAVLLSKDSTVIILI